MRRGLDYSQRFLVWVVAIVASVETGFSAIIAFFMNDAIGTIGWLVATAILIPMAAFVESIKIGRGG